MCDYSLHHVATRPAKIEDRLVTTNVPQHDHARLCGRIRAARRRLPLARHRAGVRPGCRVRRGARHLPEQEDRAAGRALPPGQHRAAHHASRRAGIRRRSGRAAHVAVRQSDMRRCCSCRQSRDPGSRPRRAPRMRPPRTRPSGARLGSRAACSSTDRALADSGLRGRSPLALPARELMHGRIARRGAQVAATRSPLTLPATPVRRVSRNSGNYGFGKQTSVSNLYPQASHSHRCRTRRSSRCSDHSGRKIVSRHWAHSLTGRDGRRLWELLVFSSMVVVSRLCVLLSRSLGCKPSSRLRRE